MTSFYENDDDSQLQTLFKLFDRDGNGRVDGTELKNVMSQVTNTKVSD
eukprot:CAMPEP_0201280952 /NCGR_PEP_ID=MMETSP1317-20130820/42_1 /ASSEMBLY_ACC=CAM_ASM_000770 /TAXON_ID=187299 /ORGANISM="Undescribed Undescribed, Strain Undescribed" /LENGTH=47 /DNA_ID= /DNA_START= /DNA_END= /DNA_ORIENTATION=